MSVSVTIVPTIVSAQPVGTLDLGRCRAQTELKERIEAALPGAHVRSRTSPAAATTSARRSSRTRFEGLTRIQQHKLVYDVFGDEVGGPIHALSIKTSTPETDQMTNAEIRDFIENAIEENKVMLFMKGTPEQPALRLLRCAPPARLNALGVRYAALDILPDPRIREELSALSGWPTIPQLFVDGELVGGCDIVIEMYESGELAEMLGVEQPEERRCAGRRAGAAPGADRAREQRLN